MATLKECEEVGDGERVREMHLLPRERLRHSASVIPTSGSFRQFAKQKRASDHASRFDNQSSHSAAAPTSATPSWRRIAAVALVAADLVVALAQTEASVIITSFEVSEHYGIRVKAPRATARQHVPCRCPRRQHCSHPNTKLHKLFALFANSVESLFNFAP